MVVAPPSLSHCNWMSVVSPLTWKIVGTTTFGSPVEEYFQADDDVARWRDASGPGDATYKSDPHFVH